MRDEPESLGRRRIEDHGGVTQEPVRSSELTSGMTCRGDRGRANSLRRYGKTRRGGVPRPGQLEGVPCFPQGTVERLSPFHSATCAHSRSRAQKELSRRRARVQEARGARFGFVACEVIDTVGDVDARSRSIGKRSSWSCRWTSRGDHDDPIYLTAVSRMAARYANQSAGVLWYPAPGARSRRALSSASVRRFDATRLRRCPAQPERACGQHRQFRTPRSPRPVLCLLVSLGGTGPFCIGGGPDPQAQFRAIPHPIDPSGPLPGREGRPASPFQLADARTVDDYPYTQRRSAPHVCDVPDAPSRSAGSVSRVPIPGYREASQDSSWGASQVSLEKSLTTSRGRSTKVEGSSRSTMPWDLARQEYRPAPAQRRQGHGPGMSRQLTVLAR